MKNIKFNVLSKINKLNNYFINQFNKISIFKKIITKIFNKFSNISNFSKLLIVFISLLFLYLFYLSIPSLYDKGKLQKDFTNKILEEFKINISISADISYSILPSPHIVVNNAKIFDNNKNRPKEISQIKKLKIHISQKNLFKQNNLKITKIIIQDANFLIQKSDFKFINEFIKKKFSNKKIIIMNSNFFYKDLNDRVVSIIPVSNLSIVYNDKKFINEVDVVGNVYNIPFNFKWNKNFEKNSKAKSILKLNKLKIEIKNNSSKKNNSYKLINEIIVGNSKFVTELKFKDNLIKILSLNSKLINNNIEYIGQIDFEPFNFNLDIDLDKLNLKKLYKSLDFLIELLKLDILYNNNLSLKISSNINNIKKNKVFDSSKIFFNSTNGTINLNNSYLISNKIGKLTLSSSNLGLINKELFFEGTLVFTINDQKEFYRVFQVPKKSRKTLKNITFEIEINLFNNSINIKNFIINDQKSSNKDEKSKMLDEYNFNLENQIKNWIDLKKFINKIFLS
jgi:hypothetical protein